jgi:hypothetical protein
MRITRSGEEANAVDPPYPPHPTPLQPPHLWVVSIVRHSNDGVFSSKTSSPCNVHRFNERTLVTRRGYETIVNWQYDNAEPEELVHDRFSQICIPPLQADTGVRVETLDDLGMSELDGFN